MQTRIISVRSLLIISIGLLVFTNTVTYWLLLSKNKEWKMVVLGKDNESMVAAEALGEHVYYDGDSIQHNLVLRHYTRSGKLIKSVKLNDVLQGDKVVMLLSPNCCSSCARGEINKLLDLSKKIGSDRLIFIADYAMHTEHLWTMCLDKDGFYETDVEHLGLKGSPTRETPVVMLTHNGRVKTSFVVGQQTSDFVDGFHDYLIEYFKGKK